MDRNAIAPTWPHVGFNSPIVQGGGSSIMEIADWAYLKSANAGTNYHNENSGDIRDLYYPDDVAATLSVYAFIKFPRPIVCGSLCLFHANFRGLNAGADVANYFVHSYGLYSPIGVDSGSFPGSAISEVTVRGVTGMGGRTVSDLTWTNKGDLVLAPASGAGGFLGKFKGLPASLSTDPPAPVTLFADSQNYCGIGATATATGEKISLVGLYLTIAASHFSFYTPDALNNVSGTFNMGLSTNTAASIGKTKLVFMNS